jgi:tetratricopeptide (TPR) repeat protein
MAVPLDRPLVSPILVGRTPQLAALERALERAHGGNGETMLIAGEAGIGKSRLVDEIRARAEQQGSVILEGHCFEPDRALPYAPFIDLLRALLAARSGGDVADRLGRAASDLVRIVPELADRLPGIPDAPILEPEQERHRLVNALVETLAGLAAARPAAVVIEDLHWSDDASLDVLFHLARRARSFPLLLLLTYRGDEVNPSLGHLLAELDRGRLATELLLAPLSAAEVDAMLRAILGLDRPPHPDFLATIQSLSEGNPFFIEEIVRTLVATSDLTGEREPIDRLPVDPLHVPRSVQDAVGRRIARLTPDARWAIELAAVAGRRFDFALLQALLGCDEGQLLALIRETIGAQLVVEESAERFAFRHALTRQAVYAGLLARQRRALHRQIALTLERLAAGAPDAPVEDLSYHFGEAEDWPKVLDYARLAGEQAQALDAPRAAVTLFSRAFDAARRLGQTPPAALYRARGMAHETLGNFEQACGDLEAALETARLAGVRAAEWQALLDLGWLWAARDYARTGEYNRQALDLAREIDQPAMLAQSLNRLGNWHMNVAQLADGRRYHQEALAIFQALDDRRGIAETLDLLGLVCNMSGDLPGSVTHYRQAIERFRELGDRQRLASSLAVLATRGMGYVSDTLVWTTATPAEPIQEAEEALRLTREIGWRSGESYALAILGDCLGTQGDYGAALQDTREALAIATEIGHHEWTIGARCTLGMHDRDLLAWPAARGHLERALALAEARAPYWAQIVAGLLASTCVSANDLPRATAVLDLLLRPETPMELLGQRLCWLARAELALARGDAAPALDIVERLVASAPGLTAEQVIPRLWHLRGEALSALGRLEDAGAALRAAADAAGNQGRRPLLWRIRLSFGRLYRTQGRADAAERELSRARAIVAELAAGIPDGPLRDTFLGEASALIPPPPSLTPRQAAKRAYGGLTTRERQVAALIAHGKANRAIATELFLSERTVEGHVASILSKLGFDARTRIAAWAVEMGLARRGE